MRKINNDFKNLFQDTKAVVMLHAHADDESFLSAGIIQEFVSRGYQVVLIYCASGIVNNEPNTLVRQKELFNASTKLGISELHFLKYCEPKYKTGNPLYLQSPKIVARDVILLLNNLNITKPILFSYDKNGGYGNKDHIFVHKLGRILADILDLSNMFEVTIPRDLYTPWFKKRSSDEDKSYLPQLEYWSENFGLANNEIDYVFSLTERQVKIKRKALLEHVSQVKRSEFPLLLSDIDFTHLFGNEYFHKP